MIDRDEDGRPTDLEQIEQLVAETLQQKKTDDDAGQKSFAFIRLRLSILYTARAIERLRLSKKEDHA